MSGDGVLETHQLFQVEDGGAIPTSPHQLFFREINYQTAMGFVKKHHYLHRVAPTSVAYGAYFDNRLVGVCTIGKPASHTLIKGVAGEENADRVFELNRLCLLDEIPKNSESRFLGWVLREVPRDWILVSYADTDFGHEGIVYRATNWKYVGDSIPFTDKTLPGKDHRSVPKNLRKNNPDLISKKRSLKRRYVYSVNGDYDDIRWEIKPYPA